MLKVAKFGPTAENSGQSANAFLPSFTNGTCRIRPNFWTALSRPPLASANAGSFHGNFVPRRPRFLIRRPNRAVNQISGILIFTGQP